MEQKIIAAVLSSREHWESVSPHITDNDLTPEGIKVWRHIKDYYNRDSSATSVDLEILSKKILRKVKDNPKHEELLRVYLDSIRAVDISEINVIVEVLDYKKDVVSSHLAEALVSNDQARSRELMEQLQKLDAAVDLDLGVDEEYQGMDLGELLSSFSEENLIKVAPRSLNRRLGGGALRGHHILLAAMPETGKSLFALHMANGFVGQNLKVLYIGNEDPVVSLVLRFVSNLTRRTKIDLMEDPEGCMTLASQRGYDRIVFAGLSPGTLPELRALVVKHQPDVLIVDQLRNIQAKSENRTNQLETVARGMRDIARQYNLLAISVTQAAETARNKTRLDMGDIDGSNIGMPGACDVMVMVGMNEDSYNMDQRHISLAKNKLTGEHDHWIVRIDKQRSMIIDVDDVNPRRAEHMPHVDIIAEKM